MADKKGAPRPKTSDATIMRALNKTGFNITSAAKVLGKSRTWLSLKLNEEGQLKEIFNDARELVLDDAEYELHKLVKRGDFNAIKFALSTRGRGRGFGAAAEVTGNAPKPAVTILPTMTVEESAQIYRDMLADER